MRKKVILGLSGGVDSSVALIELMQQGYDVEAVFMRNWDSTTNHDILGNPDLLEDICPQEKDYADALSVANHLGVKLHRIDFIEEYWEYVFQYFLSEYRKGRTPNPDIMCNKEIKFKAFLTFAESIGADYIAMGHYARVVHEKDHSYLLKGLDGNKDQTYFLSQINQSQLRKSLFPIGDMDKSDVRRIALEYQLITAKKKDSTGICFIGERDFNAFLSNYLPAQKGKMMTLEGDYIKDHEGLMYYTIGQRKGLGIGGLEHYDNEPWFAIGKDLESNTLYVGQGFHHPYLYSDNALITDINWINPIEGKEIHCMAKFRYRQADQPVVIRLLENNAAHVYYKETVRAVTPGQAAVFYQGDVCLGGGTIDTVYFGSEKRNY